MGVVELRWLCVGVVIGGLLTKGAGWRWVMFVNVPVGALLMVGIASSLLALAARADARSSMYPARWHLR
ncbi:hypothetical protein [Acidovorax sp. LjRoot117]|uniref:hypothetical protein n=1 Tax=Acidovorax sp. LjRoot117 TaxID=3342255 RepID=UPI003ED13302